MNYPPGYKERLVEEVNKHWSSPGSFAEKQKTAGDIDERIRAEFGLEHFIVPAHQITTRQQATRALGRCNSYTRLAYLVDLMDYLSPADWFELARDHWSTTDNVWEHTEALRDYFSESTPAHKLLMMTDEELAVYHSLPEKVTVYRGCGELNKDGLSWTLSEQIAKGFTDLNRYKTRNAIVIKKTIAKSLIVAVKLDRQEQEIIVNQSG